ncbi:MAG: hypothetical protein K2J25_06690, partial [Oscillospiraceae bacterium]|nr:hypothetical protein [Oscillospiraceae bacterium]
LNAGSHEIVLKYSPKGFISGILIGIGCIGILILLWLWERKHPVQEEAELQEEVQEMTEDSMQEKKEQEENEIEEVLDAYFSNKQTKSEIIAEEDAVSQDMLTAYLQNENHESQDSEK